MILLLDVGNTRIKWRPWHDGDISQGDALPYAQFLDAFDAGQVCRETPQRILVACVGNEAVRSTLQSHVANRWGLSCEFFLATAEAAGVKNAYAEPQRLGVDRWLALLAIRHRCQGPALVVDAGSALTLDVLGADGRHVGGLIVPGLDMMQASLFTGTGQVRFPREPARRPSVDAPFGRETETAVKYGSFWSAISLIEGMSARTEMLLGTTPTCFLCGGDAPALSEALRIPHRVQPDLVIEGLALQAGLELRL